MGDPIQIPLRKKYVTGFRSTYKSSSSNGGAANKKKLPTNRRGRDSHNHTEKVLVISPSGRRTFVPKDEHPAYQ